MKHWDWHRNLTLFLAMQQKLYCSWLDRQNMNYIKSICSLSLSLSNHRHWHWTYHIPNVVKSNCIRKATKQSALCAGLNIDKLNYLGIFGNVGRAKNLCLLHVSWMVEKLLQFMILYQSNIAIGHIIRNQIYRERSSSVRMATWTPANVL